MIGISLKLEGCTVIDLPFKADDREASNRIVE